MQALGIELEELLGPKVLEAVNAQISEPGTGRDRVAGQPDGTLRKQDLSVQATAAIRAAR